MTLITMIVTRFIALTVLILVIPLVIVWIVTRGWGGPEAEDA